MYYKGNFIEEKADFIKESIAKGKPMMEIARDLGVKYETLKRHLNRLGIDWKKNQGRANMPHYESRVPAMFYIENNIAVKAPELRRKLIEDGIKESKCERCGITEWMGDAVPLELHHLDGNHYNNKLENLAILCSNCHAQLHGYNKPSEKKPRKRKCKERKAEKEEKENFCSECGEKISKKAKTGLCVKCQHELQQRKTERPSKTELEKLLKENNFLKVGKMFGVSDNAVRKWCRYYGLSTSSKNYK